MSDVAAARRLPVLPGANHLDFRCNGCGACCRTLRVAITHHDLARLSRSTGREPACLVDWLPPDGVDMTGEPGSFVELREGRRLMVLAQREGACQWLDQHQRCTVYAARPLDCRLFPFDLSRDDTGLVVRIERLPLDGCGDERGDVADLAELSASDERRWRELGEYQQQVARFNRWSRHRLRFRQALGGAGEFIEFVLRDVQG